MSITLNDLVKNANTVTDEAIAFSTAVTFVNDCVAKINITLDAKFPTYTANDSALSLPIPDKWALAVFVPFISAKIKQIDGVQFEFEKYYNEFYENLDLFKAKYTVPDEYKDEASSFAPDFTLTYNHRNW